MTEKIGKSTKRISIRDVAKEAKVSVSTVSRVIRKYDNVPQETEDKVLKAIRKLNYIPNVAASNLGSGELKNIGVVFTRSAERAFENPFFSEVLKGISHITQECDYNLQLITYDDIAKERVKVIELLRSGMIAGVIILSTRQYDPLIQDLLKFDYPFVVSGRVEGVDLDQKVYSVNTDNVKGSFQIVKHLIEFRHEHIAIINGPLEYIVNRERHDGYRRALAWGTLEYNPAYEISGGYTFDDAREAVKKKLQSNPEITAIFAKDDMKAIAAIKAIRELGLDVPKDVAVVGYNNYDISTIIEPQLTTVSVPIYDLGTNATRLLLNIIQKKEIVEEQIFLPIKLIVRESCDFAKKRDD